MTDRSRSVWTWSLGVLASLVIATPAARAGDGPFSTQIAPFQDGTFGRQSYIAPGVISKRGFETVFLCTNLDSPGTSANIGVEIFDQNGTRLNNISVAPAPGACNGAVLGVPAGSTRTIATDGTVQLHEDCKINVPSFDNGSARIVSTAGRLTCSGMVIDSETAVVDPATGSLTGKSPSAVAVKLIKKNKQAGD